MKTRLVGITEPKIEGIKSAGEFVGYVARVSNPANQLNTETAPKLLKSLRRDGHWSPFEMAHAVIEVMTTRDIARQILRHRSFSFQEFSQRYAEASMFETSAARRQDQKNRQNSIDDLPEQVQIEWRAMQEQLLSVSSEMYGRALGLGIAKECARKVLPEGLTVSVLYMAGSLRSWIHYLDQRCDPSTQLEHRQVAESIKAILAQEIPEIFQ